MSAATHREKLLSLFDDNQDGVIFLKGADVMYRYGTDYEFPFRQESNFWYLAGVNEPEYQMVLDLKTGEFHLFHPKRDAQFAVWHGRVKTEDQIRDLYSPDHLHELNDLLKVLKALKPSLIYCLNEEQAEFIEDVDHGFTVETETLQDAITYCRCIKTDEELELMREAARINNIAHLEVMKAIKPGMYEYEAKAIFDYHQLKNGLLQPAYNGIHAGGTNSAILHYVENNHQIHDGELYLIDAGYEKEGYASDVTRTYPVNGTFTGDQAAIYQVVLDALNKSIERTRPGVKMEDLHMGACRIILQGLKDAGVVKGDLDEMMEKNIFALFFPHGLGHFLGLDTHDVGGYPKGVERIDRPGIRFLRVRRELMPGMVITIEPGIYFIPALLKPALENSEQSKFLNAERIQKLFGFGGVRIEDNLVITEDGNENLTDVPKEIKEIEAMMKS
ncbi:aminopeptidase P family protein [Rhodohalobacter mucosus]|uniref:Xaa-Pro aminopeptidase n=1 Tax=Rhodohalobacter mucosus TaxID=2079485 RepID=A0A316TX29_9BACT|nr:aminopeptidase P family protein [Rhodohalobacter mucosus]PWN07979.1 Xaa-Pro aminopeptidase [Rhodohalobacter mucosus]